MKKKICVFIGGRANYSSLKSVMIEIKRSKKLELILVIGASAVLDKFGNIYKLIENEGFIISEKIFNIIEGETPETMAKSTGLLIIELSTILNKYKPDYTIIVGDRYEMLSVAVASAYNNIPIAHIMGGESSGTIDGSIRHAITKLSHIHFPATKKAYNRIIRMGEDPKYVFNVGCPRIDIVRAIIDTCHETRLEDKLYNYLKSDGVGLDSKDFNNTLVILQHPVTTEYGKGREQITITLESVKDISIKHNLNVIVLWSNPDAGEQDISTGIRNFRENNKDLNFKYIKHIPFELFIYLLYRCKCLIGNSSAGIRDCSYIGTPVINIGTRQTDREQGYNVVDVDYDMKQIKEALEIQIQNEKFIGLFYGDGTAGKQIAKILENVDVPIQKRFYEK